MTKDIVAIGVTKRKSGPYKIKFAKNLKARLRTCTPLRDFDLINFVELSEPNTKLQALEFALNHATFEDVEVKKLVQQKLDKLVAKDKKVKYNSVLTQSTTVKDILDAVQM